jgi:GAF domain-containing protein
LSALISATQHISQGNWETSLPTTSQDELGDLARNFNAMVQQIRNTLDTLEITNQTMQTVAQVNAQISTILETDRLLQDVVDLTKERFRLYHAHIYQLNEAGDTLELVAGAGNVGRQMVSEKRRIALQNKDSIVATSARNRQGVIIEDVRKSRTFLPHPLLPETASELAVPLIARGRVLGVLDVQSDVVDFFTAESFEVMQLLAGQVATALSNARLYEVAERTSRHEAALSNIDAKIQSANNMDDVLQTAVRELGKALRVPHTAIEIQSIDQTTNGQPLVEDSNA